MRWFAALVLIAIIAVASVSLLGTDASPTTLLPERTGGASAVVASVDAPEVTATDDGDRALRVEAEDGGGETAAPSQLFAATGNLNVHVFAEDGAPAAAAEVSLATFDPALATFAPSQNARADSSGLATFAVPSALQFVATARRGDSVSEPAAPLRAGETITLRLGPAAGFFGRVISSRNDAAIPNALLVLHCDESTDYTATMSDGTFRFAPRRRAPHRLEIVAPGHERTRLVITPATTAQSIRLDVADSLRGEVVTDSGVPIANARVEAIARRRVGESRLSLLLAETRSDANGRFTLESVAEDGFDLVATSDRGRAALEIEDDPGGEVRIVVPTGRTLRGEVLLADGSPAADAVIQLLDLGAFDAATRKVKVDANGWFSIERVRTDRAFRLVATAPNATPAIVAIPDPEAGEVRVRLAAANHLEGTVRTIDGSVVADAVVEIEMDDAAVLRASTKSRFARSDSAGRYRFTCVPPGTLRVRATAGAGTSEFIAVGVIAGNVTTQDLLVERLESLTGRVVDEREQPIEGARIRVFRAAAVADRDATRPSRSARSTVTGSFTVDGLPRGEVSLEVSAPGRTMLESTVTLPVAGDFVVRLGVAPTLRGRVLAAANLAPIESFAVRVELVAEGDRSAVRKQSFQSPDGSFELTDLPLGDLDLVVRADGYTSFGPVRIDASATSPLEIRLDSAASLAGRIVNPAKTPVAGVRIFGRCFESNGSPRLVSTHSGPDGTFRLRDLPFGRIEYGIGDSTTPVLLLGDADLRSGERDVGDLAVPATASLAIEVAASWLTPGARIVVRGARTRSRLEPRLEDGRTSLGPLLADRYVVEVDRPDAPDPRETIDLAEGASGRVELEERP